MGDVQHIPNHTIDPKTGFLQSLAYDDAFSAERKTLFLETFINEGLGLDRTCRLLHLSTDTVKKHCAIDPVFKEAFLKAKAVYGDELEAVSRKNALNPKSVIERIFQLKALFPEKYGDQRGSSTPQITINFDGKLIEAMKKRETVIDAEIVDNQLTESAKNSGSDQMPSSDLTNPKQVVDNQ